MPVTPEDIARALNVSKMTVSRAINNHPEISTAARERVPAARKMNYRPNQFARALMTNQSYLIGIVVPDLMHSCFAEICRGVETHARPVAYQNLICSFKEEPRKEQDEIEALLSRTDALDPLGFFRFTQTEAFVADSWKVNRRLSLELGISATWTTARSISTR